MSYKPKFFTDTHIAKPVAIQLRRKNIDVLRCEEIDLENADDADLLAYAAQENRVMLTCDEDFRDLHYQWLGEGKPHSGIIKMDQEKHCKNIGKIVKIVNFFHAVVDDPSDCLNRLYDGGVFDE